MDEALQAGLIGGVFDGQLGTHHAVGFLDAQHVHGANAEGFQAEVMARLEQRIEYMVLIFNRMMDFPTQLADEIDPGGPRRRHPDDRFLRCEPAEGVVR